MKSHRCVLKTIAARARVAAWLLASPLAAHAAWTTGTVPSDGVYKFTFGVDSVAEGFAVPADAVYDVQGTGYYDGTASATFSYGFLGTTEDSYKNDVPVGSKVTDVRQIDGFSVVEGQYIILHNTNDLNGVSCVCGPAQSEYLPANASSFEGRYPVRFAMRAEERAYYAVTCTVANASSTVNADITLYSERSHLHAHHMTLAPGEKRTFAWSVELAPNYAKAYSDSYRDNAINVCVVGENAALASVTVVKQPQTSGTVRGEAVANMNVGKSIWICTDSTGCDYPVAVPFFSGQNYGGVGAGLSRWAPANISICNQGEGGLATNSKTHRQSCLLKPGDYLYVEYGHNESSVQSYTNNLETYLTDAKTAGAKLLIVSPVERHTSWNSTTKYWEASLAGIRDGGRAWVEDKIAQGETYVAFVDLNTHYLNWMNSEVDRICTAFPSMNRSAAINYYYQSSKGKNVDGTHLNTFGEDQGAYAFWQAALAIVAAGEGAAEGTSAKIQADVVKGITEGYQDKLGLGTEVANTPYLVSDEIIAAGVAPNTFWDTPVTTMLGYVKDVAVADVIACTNVDGTVTISNATLRVLNISKYCKAVYDIVSADGATTNRYYSYYNYDTTPFASGDLVVPEQPGFIDSDKAAGGEKDRDTITIPVGGKAYVWFAVADDETWQVGEAAPCSAIYPVEAWSKVLVDDNGEDASNWSAVTQSEYTFTENEAGYYDFTGTGYASDGKTKKNFGMFRDFDDSGTISGGRYRVSFKVLYTAGSFTFCVQKTKGTTTSPTDGAVSFVKINTSKAAEILGTTTAQITLVKDANEVLQPSNRINVDAWTDVDMIVDMDLGTAEVSVGGSDYETYTVGAYSQDTAIANLPYNYFSFSLESQMSHFGALDDVKVVQLTATSTLPDVTVAAAANDGELGTVTINGESVASANVELNSAVTLVATPAEGCIFLGWLDENSEYVSTDATWNIARCHNPVSVTADFRSVVNATATSADETMGTVKINGGDVSPLQVYSNTDIAFTAVSADPDMYAFVCWRDGVGNDVSSNATFLVENATADCSYTAIFREYGEDENRVIKWDFSDFIVDGVAATANLTTNYNGLAVSLQNGDSLSGDGLYWANVGSSSGSVLVGSTGRHIEWTAPFDGTMSVVFSVSSTAATGGNGKPVYVSMNAIDADGASIASVNATAANTETTLEFNAVAGTTYSIYTYYYNRSSEITVKSISYTYAPTYYTVSVSSAGNGSASVSASEVLGGKSVTFTATPFSAAYKFVNWTDGETEVSTDAVYTAPITADTTLTANFAALGEENYAAKVNFDMYSGDNAITVVKADGTVVVTNGCFEIYMSGTDSYGSDSISENGIYWHAPANNTYINNGDNNQRICTYPHYIRMVAPYTGTVKIVFQANKVVSSRTLNLNVTSGELSDTKLANKLYGVAASTANTDFEFSYEVTAGTTYWFWTASQNWDGAKNATACTISSITYTHASDPVTLTLSEPENGSVAINGVEGAGDYLVQKGEYVQLTATPNIYYGFDNWTEDDGATTNSTEETFWYYVDEAKTVTANFASESLIDITRNADFAPFAGDDAITNTTAVWSQLVGRMEVHGDAGDALTQDGIYWAGPGTTKSDTTKNTSGRYIKFTCVKSGTVTLVFKGDMYHSSSQCPRMYVTDGTSTGIDCMYKTATHVTNADASAANSNKTLTFNAEADKTYYIWPYYFNKSDAKFWITSISYAAVKSDYSPLTIVGASGSSTTNLYYGSTISLNAPATSGTQIFTKWMTGETELGSSTHLLYTATNTATVAATYRDADIHNFVWNSEVASGNWDDAANWLYEGLVPAETCPNDASQDVVTFDSAATVTLLSNATASNVWFNADATLTGGKTLTAKMVAGEGVTTLNDFSIANISGQKLVVSNDLVMAGTATNNFYAYSSTVELRGDISGSAPMKFALNNNGSSRVRLFGNNNGYIGDALVTGGRTDARRSVFCFENANAASSNAYWTVSYNAASYNSSDYRMLKEATHFGGYWGELSDIYDGSKIVVGYLSRDSYVYFIDPNSGREFDVEKVGSANLKFGTALVRNLVIQEGSVTPVIGTAINTLTLAEGTEIRIAGDSDWEVDTVTNLFSYTTLSGRTAEQLASQVVVTGLGEGKGAEISVEDNVVKATIVAMPTTDDENATITKDGDNYKIEVQAEEVALTIPDGVTVSEVVVSPNTTNITVSGSGTLAANVKVAVSWDGGSATYAIVTIGEGGAVTLNPEATVRVDTEDIPVRPVLSDTNDETKPFTVGEDVSLGVKTIPGLVYRLNRATTPDFGTKTPVAEAKATSSRTELTDTTDRTGSNVFFYKISADLK